jgi:hypothetical protein
LKGVGKELNGKYNKGGYVGFRINQEEDYEDIPENYVLNEI